MAIEELKQNTSPGKQLFNSASDFYSWYMTWINTPSSQANVFQTLSELMRIALLSSDGGNYLSFQEEEKSIKDLSKLKEELCDGNLKKENTFQELRSLVDNIISRNPKAKLVSYATELEYRFCILKTPSTQAEYLQKYLKELLTCVTPSLLEIQAYAIGQIMGKILENPSLNQDAGRLLEKEVKQWLRQM